MRNHRPQWTRWDLLWAGGAVAISLLWVAIARTPFYDPVRVLFLTGLVALGVSDWRAKGHGWLPTLSWTLPLGLFLLVERLVDRSSILGPLGYGAGGAFGVVMMASDRAAAWWYKVVLRRPYKS